MPNIQAYNRSEVDARSYFEDIDPIESQRTEQRKAPLLHTEDKLISATNEELKTQRADILRPQLQKPEAVDHDQILECSRKVNMCCARLDREIFRAQVDQIEIFKDPTIDSSKEVQRVQHDQKLIGDDYQDTWTKMSERTKKSNIVGWIDTLVTMAFIAISVIAVGAAIVTMGLAIGLSAGLIAALGVAKGATSIASGALKYEGDKDKAKLTGIGFQRETNQNTIERITKSIKSSHESMNRVSKGLQEYFKHQLEAIQQNKR